MSTLAIIPAHRGSRSVPRKNVLPLAGKPLIARTIGAALAAGSVDRVVVSTDDAEIKAVALQFGAEAVDRPPELATDTARSESALLHALEHIKASEGYRPDVLVFLQCRSPSHFRRMSTARLRGCGRTARTAPSPPRRSTASSGVRRTTTPPGSTMTSVFASGANTGLRSIWKTARSTRCAPTASGRSGVASSARLRSTKCRWSAPSRSTSPPSSRTLKLMRPDLRCVNLGSVSYQVHAYGGDTSVETLLRPAGVEVVKMADQPGEPA